MNAVLKAPPTLQTKVVADAYLLYEALVLWMEAKTPPAAAYQTLVSYVQMVQRVAQQTQWSGLDAVCVFITANLQTLQEGTPSPAFGRVLEQWPRLLMNYLSAPNVHNKPLIYWLQEHSWPLPLSSAQAEQFIQLLNHPSPQQFPLDDAEEIESRPILLEGGEMPLSHEPPLEKALESFRLEDDAKTWLDEDILWEVEPEQPNLATDSPTLPAESWAPLIEKPAALGGVAPDFQRLLQNYRDLLEETLPAEELPVNDLLTVEEPKAAPVPESSPAASETRPETHAEGTPANLLKTHAEGTPANLPETQAEGTPANRLKTQAEGASANRPETQAEGTPANLLKTQAEGTPANRPETQAEGTPANRPETQAEGTPANLLKTQAEGAPEDSTVISESPIVIPGNPTVIPGNSTVIPAQAGIHSQENPPAKAEPDLAATIPEKVFPMSSVLKQLSSKINEVIPVLEATLEQFMAAAEDSDTYLSAVEKYTNSVYSLWELAGMYELGALEDVCTLVSDNVFELGLQPQEERVKLKPLFVKWPKLVLNYLHNPEQGSLPLIEHLKNPQWLLPLLDERISNLRVQLAQGAVVVSQADTNLTKSKPPAEILSGVQQIVADNSTTQKEAVDVTETEFYDDELISDESDDVEEDSVITAQKPVIIKKNLEVKVQEHPSKTILEEEPELEIEDLSEIGEFPQDDFSELMPENLDFTETSDESEEMSQRARFEKDFPETTLELTDTIEMDSEDISQIDQFEDTLQESVFEAEDLPSPTVNEPAEESTDEKNVKTVYLADNDALYSLDVELSETGDELSTTLSQFITADDNSSALKKATSQYLNHVRAVSAAVSSVGLSGLKKVFEFIEQNVLALSTQKREVRRAAQTQMGAWPSLMRSYLHDPVRGAQDLTGHLCTSRWYLPLKPETARQLLVELTQGILGADAKLEFLEIEAVSESKPFIDTLSGKFKAHATQLQEMVSTLMARFEHLLNTHEGGEALLIAVEEYTEHVRLLRDAAESLQIHGLPTVYEFINDNVMGLNAQEDKEAVAQTQALFTQWPSLIVAYLQNPGAGVEPLIAHLQQTAWPLPLDPTDAETLAQQLMAPFETEEFVESIETAESISHAVETEDPLLDEDEVPAPVAAHLVAPEVEELLIAQLTETAQELEATLDTLLTAEEDSEDLLTIVGTYTEHVQALWSAADMAKLEGLQTICEFINENVLKLSFQTQAKRRATRELFVRWPYEVSAYLQQPVAYTEKLISFLQDEQWFVPLPHVAELRQQLTAIVKSSQETLEDSLLEEISAAPAESEAADPAVYLAAPEVIELVRNQIIDVADTLATALEECVSMNHENPALLEALENYTQQVQTIADVAEMAGLLGLQEVCACITENLLVLGTQESPAKITAQPTFAKWPTAVLDYLYAPSSGARNLVSLLQADEWPVPLPAARAEQLLTLLTQSSTSPEQVADYEQEVMELESVGDDNLEESELETDSAEKADLAVDTGTAVSLGNAEVLGILINELNSNKEDLEKELNRLLTLPNNAPGFVEAAENYTDNVQRLQAAADMLGLEGLKTVCTFVVTNVQQLAQRDLAARKKAKALLTAWPNLVLEYLQAPLVGIVPLINHFREAEWAQPLSDDEAQALLSQLVQGSTAEEEAEEVSQRQTVATPEDVILTVPEDVNRELLEAYLQEAPQHASDFSECLQNIIREPQVTEIERAQRVAHTLKGSSNIIGIKGIANLAHPLEDILEYLAQHKVAPPPALTTVLMEAADCLEMMVDALLGQDDAPAQAQRVLQVVLDWANQIDKGHLEAPPVTAVAPAPSVASAKTPAKAAKAESVAAGTPEQVLKVPTKTVDDLMRLVGELSISIGQIQERLKHVLNSTRLLNEENLVLQQKTFELENLVDVRGVTGVENRYRQMATVDEEEEGDDFDPLEFEEYNELHSVAHSFIESIADARELGLSIRHDLSALEGMFIQQERLNKEFQNTIMTTRMVPVHTIVSKLQRNVRQTCRTTGKQAELEVSGADILIDSEVLNQLGDPLMHILRNSLSHGIETVEERALLGKPESGTIHLSFYHEGNSIVVKCQDDGQGLNYANIRHTAVQRKLIKEEQELTEAELARLILIPGFSTKSKVDQVAGRGVGMDVVHTNIRQMKGTLDLISDTGKGLTLLIKLPTTLVTVHVLLVRLGKRLFGIPTNHLEQALAPGLGEFYRVGKEVTLKVGKSIYSLKALSDLLNVPADRLSIEGYEERPIILAREETGIVALLVDELVDSRDLVMKTLGQYIKKVRGVAGASILGDGSLVPLLDLPELLRSPFQTTLAAYEASEQTVEEPIGPVTTPKIMIVDDSLSVRKSLALLMEESGFETVLAKDGLEAVELMGQSRPHVMLVDMEMPRMNGLELTAHVRANQVTQKMPIFMITSRTTEKHREQAKAAGVSAYLTKPYQDTELLNLINKALSGQL